MKKRIFTGAGITLLWVGLLLGQVGAVRAGGSYYVSNAQGKDENPCTQSLPCKTIGRAVDLAADGDTIEIAPGVYYESLVISKRLTLQGQSIATSIIDGSSSGRVIEVDIPPGAGDALLLQDLTVRKGGIDEGGAGILVRAGDVALRRVLVSGNQAAGEMAGGGLLCLDGTVDIFDTTLFDNLAAQGGGAAVGPDCMLSMENSAITQNRGASTAGLWVEGSASLSNVTISFNNAGEPLAVPQVRTGGLRVEAGGSADLNHVTLAYNLAVEDSDAWQVLAKGAVTLKNTLLYSGFGQDCRIDGGQIVTGGHNLSGDTSCGLNAVGDLANRDPLLGPLTDNGGLTRTHALAQASPAVDAGEAPDAQGLSHDQRGLPYRDGDADGVIEGDIGAFEFQPEVTHVWLALIVK